MGVIKSPNLAASLSPFSMSDIEAQAHAIITRAKSQAARILIEAQRIGEVQKQESQAAGFKAGQESGFKKGLEDGHAAGRQEALNEHREALANLIATLSAAVAALDSSRHQLESEAVVDVMKLAVAIARRVTHRLAASNPSIVNDNVKNAMKLAVRASDVRIAIHPSARQTLEAALPDLQTSWPTVRHVSLIDDAALAVGGCRIESGDGTIDADLDRQIDRIARDLLPEKECDPRINTDEHG